MFYSTVPSIVTVSWIFWFQWSPAICLSLCCREDFHKTILLKNLLKNLPTNYWIDMIFILSNVNICGTQHQITNSINITETIMRWFYIFHIKQNEEFQGQKYYIVKINVIYLNPSQAQPRLEIEIIVFLLICSSVNYELVTGLWWMPVTRKERMWIFQYEEHHLPSPWPCCLIEMNHINDHLQVFINIYRHGSVRFF